MRYLILIIFILTIIMVYLSKYNIEHYDSMIENISLDDCVMLCRNGKRCMGIGYDPIKKICYPSKIQIKRKNMGQIFSNKYKVDNIQCNKLYNDIMTLSLNNKRLNSVFLCRRTGDGMENVYFYKNNKLVKVKKPWLIDYIDGVDNYKMVELTWPQNKMDMKYVNKDLDNIKKNKLDHNKNIDINKMKINDKDDIDSNKSSKQTITYKISNAYVNNNNLYKYGCIHSVPLKRCLIHCSKNDKCKGVEWNPVYLKQANNTYKLYSNICCFKKDLTKEELRSTSFQFGKIYKKINTDTKSDNTLTISNTIT